MEEDPSNHTETGGGHQPLPARRVSRLAKVMTILVMTLVFLGAAELVARIFYRGTPAVLVADPYAGAANLEWPQFFRKHPRLFWELLPNVNEPFSFLGDRTNSRGFRNRKDPLPGKPKLRVLCLGASCTYGMGLSVDATWTSCLARLSGYEVLNAGVPGYSCYQGRLLYEDRCLDLDADVHVLEYGPSDVVTWTSRKDGEEIGLTDRERARHMSFVFDKSRSRAIDWLQSLTLPAPEDLRDVVPIEAGPRVPIEEYRENLEYLASRAPVAVLLVWPLRCQLDPDFEDCFPLERYAAYQEVVRSLAKKGYIIVEVAEAFRRSGLPPAELYLDSVHASIAGSQLIAKAINHALSQRMLRRGGGSRVK
jgi:lysophospholipase L1-like esterase